MPRAWSEFEVEKTIDDYFDMLRKELAGESYSKAKHRAELARVLDGRSQGAIEYKHENISAVLIELGHPYIEGYKPRFNYQQLLFDSVAARLGVDHRLERLVRQVSDAPATSVDVGDILSRQVPVPVVEHRGRTPRSVTAHAVPKARPVVNHLEREARNRSLGRMGERFALAFERARLAAMGLERYARQVEHVAETRGDGLGFDILSFEPEGEERLIQVKTTAFGRHTPFFVSSNELQVPREHGAHYHLYRVFSYRVQPRLFVLDGALDGVCSLSPVEYVARVG